MKCGLFILVLAMLSFFNSEAQYIAKVLEYRPAPGQLINAAPWGTPSGVHSIEGNVSGSVSLGAFGGYVVFRFEDPVENDSRNPYGVDFTIFGNPMPEWSEPGVVWVMKDENENGEPDDSWYELAGSDYWFSSTKKEYRMTYTNPGGEEEADVPWEDHLGNSGIIRANSVHTQPYYPLADSFPSIDPVSYVLEGTFLEGLVYEHPMGMRSIRRAFGYADNQLRGTEPYTTPDNPYTRAVEHSGGDAFDIGWAVDSEGSYMNLDQIHFIKVQSGMQADGGWLGELSSELTGAVDVPPDPAVEGETEMVLIRDLPLLLEPGEYQLEVKVFQNGQVRNDKYVEWTTSVPGATVSEDHMLSVSEEGPLTITAVLSDRPEIFATVSTTVQHDPTSVSNDRVSEAIPFIYPNPVSDIFRVKGGRNSTILLFEISGKELMRVDHYQEDTVLDIGTYPQGIYLLKMERGNSTVCLQLIKL
ncbi:MAG: T9SS type A sorting domain-containing protein [Bacteroidota bacterium]|nr:T9SS type A sorting domain-containing protein [Bacteroidota bacterium]